MLKSIAALLLLLPCLGIQLFAADAPATKPSQTDRHVLLIVCDGLRPDLVTEQNMPTLHALGQQGVFFEHHHPMYLSSTEVNGTAISTGAYPRVSGIIGNREYRPEIDLLAPIGTQDEWPVWLGDKKTDNHYLRVPTLTSILHRHNLRTVVAGTKSVALLLDRSPAKDKAATNSVTLYAGEVIPSSLRDKIKEMYGPIPYNPDSKKYANVPQDSWTAKVLTEYFWKNGLPPFSVMWLSEPDYSQHGAGPGSKAGLAGLKSSDDRIATVLKTLDAMNMRDKTDILVVSDHGFSTIARNFNMVEELDKKGIKSDWSMPPDAKAGDTLVVPHTGSVLFYVKDHQRQQIDRLVRFFHQSSLTGVIFTREAMEGTFPLSDVLLDTPEAPDLIVAMRWSDELSSNNVPGLVIGEGQARPGQGTHVSLSRFDMHNTLIAAGPSFKSGFRSTLPSGNADVAPTILSLLGFASDSTSMSGRVLTEALKNGQPPLDDPHTQVLEAKKSYDGFSFKQYLKITKMGKQTYIDEGNRIFE